MTPKEFVGAAYAVGLPNDIQIAIYGDHVLVDGVFIPGCPAGGPLHPDAIIGPDQKIYIGGQGHNDGMAYLCRYDRQTHEYRWMPLCLSHGINVLRFGALGAYVSSLYGSSPLGGGNIRVFDWDGKELFTITKELGVEGLAYISFPGSFPDDIHGTKEWYGKDGFAFYTKIDDVTIGQGAFDDGGLLGKLDNGPLKIIDRGNDFRFINVHKERELIGIGVSLFLSGKARTYSFDRSDLAAAETYVPPIPIMTINRPMWMGFFSGNQFSVGGWQTNVDQRSLPGNCYLNINDGLVYAKDGTRIAQYVAAEAAGQDIKVEIAAARGRHPELPVIAYWTRANHTKEVPPADWVGIEAYRGRDESVGAFENSISVAVNRCPKAVLIPQCYTSNTNNTNDLTSIPPVIARIANRFPNVVGIFPFSGPGRATGLQDHPEVKPLWNQISATIQTPTRIIMQPPKITITDYSPREGAAPLRVRAVYKTEGDSGPVDRLQWLIRKVGAKEWSLAALNPGDDPDHTYVIKEPGTWEIKLKAVGPGGEWETGAQRIIHVSSSTPQPQPEPEPQPEPQPKPTPDPTQPAERPTYDQFVKVEANQVAQTFRTARRGTPSSADLYHNAWRRLAERWPHENILKDIRGEHVDPPTGVKLPKSPTYDEFVGKESGEVAAAFFQKNRRMNSPMDMYHNAWRRLAEGWSHRAIVADILGQPIPDEPQPQPQEPTGSIQRWHADGRIFRDEDNNPVRWIGFSGFKLCELFRSKDMDTLNAIMDLFEECNIVRTWDYVPWLGTGWDSPGPEVWIEFAKYCAGRGKHIEITLLTDDNPARIEPAKQLVEALKAAGVTNVLIEVGNEPEIHKNIDTAALRSTVENSGFMYCSGDSGEGSRWYGNYLTAHTPRDNEWDRKAHDLMEYYNGGGPSSPSDPARRVPCVSDEPKKPQDTGYNVVQYKGHFGTASLLGAGATFHYEGGKFGQMPNDDEKRCYEGAIMAMKAFPADAPNFGYRRIDEQGNTSRTYVLGPCMVRNSPKTADAPEDGWRRIDADGVLWIR